MNDPEIKIHFMLPDKDIEYIYTINGEPIHSETDDFKLFPWHLSIEVN